jgi:hypothetical protein
MGKGRAEKVKSNRSLNEIKKSCSEWKGGRRGTYGDEGHIRNTNCKRHFFVAYLYRINIRFIAV